MRMALPMNINKQGSVGCICTVALQKLVNIGRNGYRWRNTDMGTRLRYKKDGLKIEDLTGKLPILLNILNILNKLPVKAKDQRGVEEAQDLFQQLVRVS